MRRRSVVHETARGERRRPGAGVGGLLAPNAVLAALCALWTPGCSPILRVAIEPSYERVELVSESAEVLRDLPYTDGASAHPTKHRLDLYRPREPGWPLLVFVHGGSFVKGDKDLHVGGQDIYGNVGRFFANRGVGVAVVNYRLQPEVVWRDQVGDVARAVVFCLEHGKSYGGDGRVFVAGHSVGAWMAARLTFDRDIQAEVGLEPARLAGIISVSGSGFDLTDEPTWEMYGHEAVWAQRFATPGGGEWKEAASITPLVAAPAPPFLLLYTAHEYPALQRQNHLFHLALRAAGVVSELMEVAHGSHRRSVLALSHPDREVSVRVLGFMERGRVASTTTAP